LRKALGSAPAGEKAAGTKAGNPLAVDLEDWEIDDLSVFAGQR
jgi:hypothetical protein